MMVVSEGSTSSPDGFAMLVVEVVALGAELLPSVNSISARRACDWYRIGVIDCFLRDWNVETQP